MGAESLRRARVPLVLMLIIVGVLIGSYSYEPSARALPVLVAWTTIGLLLLELLVQTGTPLGRRIETFLQSKSDEEETHPVPIARALTYAVVWPGLLLVMTVLVGILPAVLAYVFLSLKFVGGKSLPQALAAALAVTAFSWVLFEWSMSYQLYRGVLMGGSGF